MHLKTCPTYNPSRLTKTLCLALLGALALSLSANLSAQDLGSARPGAAPAAGVAATLGNAAMPAATLNLPALGAATLGVPAPNPLAKSAATANNEAATSDLEIKENSRKTTPSPLNEFQKYVLDLTGQSLPLYGVDFFENVRNNPNAQERGPVDNDYVLASGDQLLIRLWGSTSGETELTLDRNGLIAIPKVGTIKLAGVKASQVESVIKSQFARLYKDFELSVSIGKLRRITVYVVGQSRFPGSYALSSQSTLTSGLFASGGPSASGSIRRVQLKRQGALVTEFDLYNFLSKGDKAADVKLQDGDVIYFPRAAGYMALVGTVNTPGVYEIKDSAETVSDFVNLAGGLPIVADPRRATLERLSPGTYQPRRIEEFSLDPQGLQKSVKNGDLITVSAIIPELANGVTLRGTGSNPIRLEWRVGMRVSDVISRKSLSSSSRTVKKQNELMYSQSVKKQEGLPIAPEENLLDRIGNTLDEINLDYAVVERISREDMRLTVLPFNLGKVLTDARDPDNLVLEAGDVITLFSTNDLRVPIARRRVFVRVEGEVQTPGVYPVLPGDNLASLLLKAGGLTPDAYLYGTGFYREEVKKTQQENLQKLLQRVENEGAAKLAIASQSLGASSDAGVIMAKTQAMQQAQIQGLQRIRAIKPEGRIALGMPAQLRSSLDQLPSIRLNNADRITVPARPDFVYIFGSVNTESAMLFRAGKTVADYLQLAGSESGADLDNVILMRVDGSALTSSSFWRNEVLSTEVMPGDTIVLPEKLDRESVWSSVVRNAKDFTQILYQLGLGAAAVKTLRQ